MKQPSLLVRMLASQMFAEKQEKRKLEELLLRISAGWRKGRKAYHLPDGEVTTDRDQAIEAWEKAEEGGET